MQSISLWALAVVCSLAACGRTQLPSAPDDSAAAGGSGGDGNGRPASTDGRPSSTASGAGDVQGAVQIRTIGRVIANGSDLTMSWPATAIEFTTRATSLRLKLTVVADPVGSKDASAGIAYFIDGTYQTKSLLGEGVNSSVVPGLDGKKHVVTVVKTSEPQMGDITFGGVSGGTLEATTAAGPGRSIEFVGDSISAGWGVDGPQGDGSNCSQFKAQGADPQVSNAALAAPVLLSGQLMVDWSVVAYSGRGVYRNLDQSMVNTLPKLYGLASPDRQIAASAGAADAVVVNLGTNDFYRFYNAPAKAGFVAAYSGLLQAIRARNPKAPILCVLGPMLADSLSSKDGLPLLSTATSYVQEAIAVSGLSRVTLTVLKPNSTDVSCEYHPDQAGQRAIASQLLPALRGALGGS